jgi:hypothetical protein
VSNWHHIARAIFRRRQLITLLLLAVTLFAQSASLASENHAHHATEHCCLLCHVCQPFLQADAPAAIAPLVYVQWIAPDPSFEFFRDVFRAAASSRGPPALS